MKICITLNKDILEIDGIYNLYGDKTLVQYLYNELKEGINIGDILITRSSNIYEFFQITDINGNYFTGQSIIFDNGTAKSVTPKEIVTKLKVEILDSYDWARFYDASRACLDNDGSDRKPLI